ncbi:MAG TPA: MBL fold metallo-hydrolase [Nitrososphaeraceae archaeon]|jgi:glyoxylase-like metal-dependent hydrolase (beta-lactamase superfamily II)|nr:MBL fold metallo-hydrolase [Nitrososphaeraceae archaeon]
MTLKIEQIQVGQMANFTYLIIDEEEKEIAIIDPSWDLDKIFEIIKRNSYRVKFIINTHTHFDHILGNEQVLAITNCQIVQHENSMDRHDIAVKDGDRIRVGNIVIDILHTPGHSKDSICLIVDSKIIFTGDTLFVGNCGRIDLPGGNVNEMYDSLLRRIIKLNDELIVYPGHNYGMKTVSTIGEEKNTNYVLAPRTLQEFIQFMTGEE